MFEQCTKRLVQFTIAHNCTIERAISNVVEWTTNPRTSKQCKIYRCYSWEYAGKSQVVDFTLFTLILLSNHNLANFASWLKPVQYSFYLGTESKWSFCWQLSLTFIAKGWMSTWTNQKINLLIQEHTTQAK